MERVEKRKLYSKMGELKCEINKPRREKKLEILVLLGMGWLKETTETVEKQ